MTSFLSVWLACGGDVFVDWKKRRRPDCEAHAQAVTARASHPSPDFSSEKQKGSTEKADKDRAHQQEIPNKQQQPNR